jgi:hypothetical protein
MVYASPASVEVAVALAEPFDGPEMNASSAAFVKITSSLNNTS